MAKRIVSVLKKTPKTPPPPASYSSPVLDTEGDMSASASTTPAAAFDALFTPLEPDYDPLPPSELKPNPETPFTTSESLNGGTTTTKEQHRLALGPQARGGPAHGPPGSRPDTFLPVPEPKFKFYISDHANPNQRSKAFWHWWNLLQPEHKGRTMLYVYREWPILVQTPDDGSEHAYIDKVSGTEPLQDDNDLCDKYGAGDYKCYFNEQGTVHKRTLATLTIRGSRDLKSRPPADRRISDVNQVEMTDPQNKSYLEFLRMRGFLPEQQKGKEKEAEMAIAEAMKIQAEQSGKTLDKFIGIMERKAAASEPAADAMKNAIEVVTDGAKRSNEILQNTITSIQEEARDRRAQAKEENAGGEHSVVDLALRLVKELRPSDGAGAGGGGGGANAAAAEEIRELRAALAQAQNDRIAALEARLAAQAAAPTISPASQFTSIKEGVEAIRQMRDLTDDLGGGGAKAEAAEAIADAMPVWLKYLLPVIPVVVAALTGRAAAPVPEQMQPQPPPQPSAQPTPPQHFLPPGSAHVASGGTGPIPINRAPATTSTPTPTLAVPSYAAPSPFSPEAAALLHAIAVPLGNHLADRESSGSIFADWFIGGYGEPDYQSVASLGPEMLTETLLAFPRTLAAIQGSGRTHAEVITFVAEFCNPDFDDDEGGGEEGEETAAKAKPGPVKVEVAPAPPPEPAPAA